MQIAEFYQQFVSRGDVVFDIGANVGEVSRVFEFLGCRVLALEPVPETYRALEEAFRESPLVQTLRLAAGPCDGAGAIYRYDVVNDPLCGVSSMSPAWLHAVESVKRFWQLPQKWERQVVSMRKLDTLIADFGEPAFIKIDVEGYEADVLRGLSRPVKALSIEFTPEYLKGSQEALEILTDLGMTSFSHCTGTTYERIQAENAEDLIQQLRAYEGNREIYGDIYAALP